MATYVKMDQRLAPAVEGVRELAVVGNVPDVYLVRRVIGRTCNEARQEPP